MASALTTTETMLKGLSMGLRIASGIAYECSEHLAVHSTSERSGALRNAWVLLDQVADEIYEIATACEAP